MRILANEVDGMSSRNVYAFESRSVHLLMGEINDSFGLYAVPVSGGPKVLLKAFPTVDDIVNEMEEIAIAEEQGEPIYDMTHFLNPTKVN